MKIYENSQLQKSLKILLSQEEHQYLHEEAFKRGLSLKDYCRQKLLDDTTGLEEMRRTLRLMIPSLYNIAREVSDANQRQWLYEYGGKLWRL